MIYNGDAADILKMLPNESVHCCVTSPPYYGLRDYGVGGQIGLEETPEDYINRLIEVFGEVKRVLRNDGTLWLNIGDSYSNKSLVGIPWLLAFALKADGWFLRQDIIWAKPNPMPESVTDRCTKSHEYVFMLSKSAKYYYDAEAIKEPIKDTSMRRLGQDVENQQGSDRANGGAKTNGPMKAVCFGGNKAAGYGRTTYSGKEWTRQMAAGGSQVQQNKHRDYILANKRDVWIVSTQPYSEAHFATFPKELIRPCVLAGAPPGGTVIDPFFGSGTTGEVALEESRNFIGIELNPEYIKIAQKRISNVQTKMII